jgi:hypothetical protein
LFATVKATLRNLYDTPELRPERKRALTEEKKKKKKAPVNIKSITSLSVKTYMQYCTWSLYLAFSYPL